MKPVWKLGFYLLHATCVLVLFVLQFGYIGWPLICIHNCNTLLWRLFWAVAWFIWASSVGLVWKRKTLYYCIFNAEFPTALLSAFGVQTEWVRLPVSVWVGISCALWAKEMITVLDRYSIQLKAERISAQNPSRN